MIRHKNWRIVTASAFFINVAPIILVSARCCSTRPKRCRVTLRLMGNLMPRSLKTIWWLKKVSQEEHNGISWIVESYFTTKAIKDSKKSENVNIFEFSNLHSSHEMDRERETSDSDHEWSNLLTNIFYNPLKLINKYICIQKITCDEVFIPMRSIETVKQEGHFVTDSAVIAEAIDRTTRTLDVHYEVADIGQIISHYQNLDSKQWQ